VPGRQLLCGRRRRACDVPHDKHGRVCYGLVHDRAVDLQVRGELRLELHFEHLRHLPGGLVLRGRRLLRWQHVRGRLQHSNTVRCRNLLIGARRRKHLHCLHGRHELRKLTWRHELRGLQHL